MHFKSLAAATGLAALFMAAPVSAEIVDQSPDGFVTRDSVTVPAAPQAVWLALISPADWWSDAHTWSGDAANMTLEPQANGCFCERIPATEADGAIGLDGSVRHMTVVQSYPRRVLRMRGGLGPLQSEPADGVLTITIKATEDRKATRIVWEYVVGGHMRFEVPVIAKAVDGVMSQQLAGLSERLGGAKAAPQAPAAKAAKKDAKEGPAPEQDEPADTVDDGDAGAETSAAAAPKPAIDADDVLKALDALGTRKDD